MNRALIYSLLLLIITGHAHAQKATTEDSYRICSELSETTYWSALVYLGDYEKIRYNEAERRVTRRLLDPEMGRTIEGAKFAGESAHGNRGRGSLPPNDARANALRATLEYYEQCLTGDSAPTNINSQSAEFSDSGTYIEEIKVETKAIGQTILGSNIYFTVKNPRKNSAIKYIRMTFSALNGVGDPISDMMGKSQYKAQYTGPLAYSEGAAMLEYKYNNVSRQQPSCIKIDRLEVEHMNGQKYTYGTKEIKSAINPSQVNGCPHIE